LYKKSWPKFKQVTKKVPTPRTLQLVAFDEKSTFEFCALFEFVYPGKLGKTIKSGFFIKS
jgi:hypothetical protein